MEVSAKNALGKKNCLTPAFLAHTGFFFKISNYQCPLNTTLQTATSSSNAVTLATLWSQETRVTTHNGPHIVPRPIPFLGNRIENHIRTVLLQKKKSKVWEGGLKGA